MCRFSSCNNEDDLEGFTNNIPLQYSYIDLHIENMQHFSTEEMLKLEEAQSRMSKCLTEENEMYEITIESGSDINVSNRLFEYFKSSIDIVNKKILDGELIIYEGKLYSSEIKRTNRLRFMSSFDEEDENKPKTSRDNYWYGWTETTSYDQNQAYDYYKDFQDNSTTGVVMGMAALGMGYVDAVGGAALGSTVLINDWVANGTANRIFDAARQGGITVEDKMNYVTGSMSTTVYDSKNNKIGVWTWGNTSPGQ